MPYYTYTCDFCGASVRRFYAMARRRRHVPCACGESASRDVAADHRNAGASPAASREIWSRALGVSPGQVEGMRAFLASRGLAPHETEFDASGRMRVAGRKHQRRVERARGFVNYDDWC